MVGATWQEHVVISAEVFQAGGVHRRWISELHDLDATKGLAIIKVAEGDAPEGSPAIRYVYTWREWDLITNREVRLIRTCSDPLEIF